MWINKILTKLEDPELLFYEGCLQNTEKSMSAMKFPILKIEKLENTGKISITKLFPSLLNCIF